MKKSLLLLILLVVAQLGMAQPSVHYKFYNNYLGNTLPDFDTLGVPDAVGVTDRLDLIGVPGTTADHYALSFDYVLNVSTQELYTFMLCSDDGSRFYLDGKLLIDNDGAHGPVYKDTVVALSAGSHNIKVEYFEKWRSQSLSLFYKTPTRRRMQIGETEMPDNLDFAESQAEETMRRIMDWKGEDEVVTFPIVTDVHTSNNIAYRHIGKLAQLNDVFHYDFMVNLGDMGLNTEPAQSHPFYADEIIKGTLDEMQKYEGVFLFAPGNHDFDGGGNSHLSSQGLSEIFQQPFLAYANGNLHLTEDNCYCYYDVPEKKVRVVLLNSQINEGKSKPTYAYGNEQLSWLVQLLCQTEDGMSVVVMDHYMPHPIGRSFDTPGNLEKTASALMQLLSDFVAKKKGARDGLMWDFSEAKGNLVGLLTGDSHVNAFANENGVNYYVSQGYGALENEQLLPSQKRVEFNSRESLCVDIVVIKPQKREVRTFRLGAGGEEMDYEFRY